MTRDSQLCISLTNMVHIWRPLQLSSTLTFYVTLIILTVDNEPNDITRRCRVKWRNNKNRSPTTQERDICGSWSRTFLPACRIPFPATQEREHAARRTACSLPLAHCSHSTGQRTCGSKNRTFSASCILPPARQEKEHAVLRTTCSHPVSASRIPSPPVSCKKYKCSVVYFRT